MVSPVLRIEDEGGIRCIHLMRPHRMNAFDLDLVCALRDAIRDASSDALIRAIVLAGEGAHFCTGADLRRDRQKEQQANVDLLDLLQEVFLFLRHGSKPSVAAVQGYALGAGLSIALACDFLVSDTTAKFGAPFTGIGFVPDVGISMTLPERVGMAAARDMLLCGTFKDASEALSIGLTDEVCDEGGALFAAKAKAGLIVARAPLAIVGARGLLAGAREDALAKLQEELRLQRMLRTTFDAQEAAAAFAQKRPAVFQGR